MAQAATKPMVWSLWLIEPIGRRTSEAEHRPAERLTGGGYLCSHARNCSATMPAGSGAWGTFAGGAPARGRVGTGAGMRYRLQRRQVVGGNLPEVFGFFKSPFNLEAITPPWLGFRVLHASDPEVREGTRISYGLRLHGVPLRWESRITEYRENAMFADEQLVGPYRHWYHRHLFHAVPGGVAIEDVVEYRLPFGPLGRLAHATLVRHQLARIFDYRARVIAERFPTQPAPGGQAVQT